MKQEIVRGLISDWEPVHEAFTPSPNLISGEGTSHEDLSALSLISGRKEYWESFTCLMGYLSNVDENQQVVLSHLVQDIENKQQTRYVTEFQDYCNRVATLSTDVILSATDSMSHAVDLGSMFLPPITDCFEYCYHLHSGDSDRLGECLARCSGA